MQTKLLGVLTLLFTGIAAFSCGSSDDGGSPSAAGSAGTSAAGSNGISGSASAAGGSGGTSAVGVGGTQATGGSAQASGGEAGNGAGATPGGAGEGASGSGPDCRAFGELCMDQGDCCSGSCDPRTGTCASSIVQCGSLGTDCAAATDCCSLRCEAGSCTEERCVSDAGACNSDAECCGGVCSEGSCQALNTECRTSGNECDGDADCCSTSCEDGRCSLAVSWCIQAGDVCARSEDCCSAECVKAEGANLGTCAAPPEGASFCGGVDGMVCEGCNACCSRLCAPFGPSGRSICQPASGCHVTGDLCREDRDCCGGDPDSGLPGAGNVVCEVQPGAVVGICRNPNSCNPQGNVCHFQDYECSISSARSNCCGALGAMSGGCQLDTLGVPRCNGLDECRESGETCAGAADCCDGLPCVPDASGALRCGETACVATGNTCTINADCCRGTLCIRSPGSTSGMCSTSVPPPGSGGAGGSSGDAGAPGSGGSDATGGTGGSTGGTGTGGSGGATACAEYGQQCDTGSDCCNAVPCDGGICRFVVR
jgi:hypothetical protein